jgi:dihydroflavonol-4-reductase
MAKTLVTGATGFIGSHVAKALLERGDDVRITVRTTSPEEAIAGLDVERVVADVTDRRAIKRALAGVDRVFHLAGSTSLRRSAADLWRANVDATRVVLEGALAAGVQRVVYTSSVAAIGPAEPGGTADEQQPFRAGDLAVPYVQSKHAAEVEALRVAARGLALVMVCPAHVLGPGDFSRSSTEVVRRFLVGGIPAYVPGAINVVDVRDVAAGHLLADESGEPGERYILGNRNYTWDRFFAELARLSGVEAPALRLTPGAALALAEALGHLPGRPAVTPVEVRGAAQWWTYKSTKARRALGWKTRPHEETVEETIRWWQERLDGRAAGRQPIALRLAGTVVRLVGGMGARVSA